MHWLAYCKFPWKNKSTLFNIIGSDDILFCLVCRVNAKQDIWVYMYKILKIFKKCTSHFTLNFWFNKSNTATLQVIIIMEKKIVS